jgi:hypothetical protein
LRLENTMEERRLIIDMTTKSSMRVKELEGDLNFLLL